MKHIPACRSGFFYSPLSTDISCFADMIKSEKCPQTSSVLKKCQQLFRVHHLFTIWAFSAIIYLDFSWIIICFFLIFELKCGHPFFHCHFDYKCPNLLSNLSVSCSHLSLCLLNCGETIIFLPWKYLKLSKPINHCDLYLDRYFFNAFLLQVQHGKTR